MGGARPRGGVIALGLADMGRDVGGELFGTGRSRDNRADRGLRGQAGDCDVEQGDTAFFRVGLEGLDDVELLVAARLLCRSEPASPGPGSCRPYLPLSRPRASGK